MGKGRGTSFEETPGKKNLLVLCSGFQKMLNDICKCGF